MNNEIVNGLISRCNELILESTNNDDNDSEKLYKKVLQILKVERCFELMDAETAFNILLDLGFNQEEAMFVYKKIIEE